MRRIDPELARIIEATATHLRKLDASTARMAAEHKAGTVGSTPVASPAITNHEDAA